MNALLAGVLSVLMVAGFYWISWSAQLEELGSLDENLAMERRDSVQLPIREAEVPEREKALEAELSQMLLPPGGPATEGDLRREWQPLLKRAGLSVQFVTVTQGASDQPWNLVQLKAEGPKDEIFRLLDGLLRSPRPITLDQLELACGKDRARAMMSLLVYRP